MNSLGIITVQNNFISAEITRVSGVPKEDFDQTLKALEAVKDAGLSPNLVVKSLSAKNCPLDSFQIKVPLLANSIVSGIASSDSAIFAFEFTRSKNFFPNGQEGVINTETSLEENAATEFKRINVYGFLKVLEKINSSTG